MSERKPFSGTCPMCSYSDSQAAKPVSSQMNTYKNQKGELGVFPNHVDEFSVKGNTWIKQAPLPGTSPIALIAPTTSAAIKAAVELARTGVSLENSAGDPVTGIAKGATIVGRPDAKGTSTVDELLART